MFCLSYNATTKSYRAAFCINSQLAPIWRLKNKHYRLIYLQSSCATIIFALACCAQAMEQLQTMTSVAETAWWKRIIRSQMSPSPPLACELFYNVALNPIAVSVCSYFSHLCWADAAALANSLINQSFLHFVKDILPRFPPKKSK